MNNTFKVYNLVAIMKRERDIFDDSDSSQLSNLSDKTSKEHVSYFQLLVDKIINDANLSICDDDDDDDNESDSMEEETEEVDEDLREKELYREIVKLSKKTYNLTNVLEDDGLWQDIIEKADEFKRKANQFSGSDESYFEMALKQNKTHIMEIIRDTLNNDINTNNDNTDKDSESSQNITQSGAGKMSDSDDDDVDKDVGQIGLGLPRTKYDIFL